MSGEPILDKPFNCRSEGGFIERAVCSDITVEATHRRMSELYDTHRRTLRGEALRAAIDEHRTWLRRRTTECKQPKFNPETIIADLTPCLLTITAARLRELENKPAK